MHNSQMTSMMTSLRTKQNLHEDAEESKAKHVRINDKAQDLCEMHAARLTRKLRRMKRRLLLDAMADDPTNSGNSQMSLNNSSSSLREDEDDGGEAAFRRGRLVRYHDAGSNRSIVFDSNSSVYSDLTEAELNEINQAIQQRRDDIDY